jgi:hypothetical protein
MAGRMPPATATWFFDQDRIVQTEAVVGAAAMADRRFLERAHVGRGLARVDDGGIRPRNGLDEPARGRRDAGEMAEDVQRGAFRGQNRAQRPVDAGDRRPGAHAIAVGGVQFDPDAFVDEGERAGEGLNAGDHAGRAADGLRRSHRIGRHDRIGRDVAGAAQILAQRRP